MTLQIENVTLDCADARTLSEFWCRALDMEVATDLGEFIFLRGKEGGPRLGLQQVAEPRLGKNRVHLDLHASDREEEVKRLTALGAHETERHNLGNFQWVVMADPEGNEFCVG